MMESGLTTRNANWLSTSMGCGEFHYSLVWSGMMKPSSGSVRFRLPIPWDIAVAVLKHTAHNGRTPFRIVRQGNGYLRLEHSRAFRRRITVDLNIVAERDTATTVMAVDVTRGMRISTRSRHQVDALLDQFKSDAEFFATRLDRLSEPVTDTAIDGPPPSIGKHATILPST